MKNLYKIFIFILLIFTTTSVVLGDNNGATKSKNNSKDSVMEEQFNFDQSNLSKHFSVKASVGVTDVYGSIHELTPINVGKTLGHSVVGLGFYKAPLINWRKTVLCVDANINASSPESVGH